jgi:hypothetical protein
MPRLQFSPDEVKRYIKSDLKGFFYKDAVEIAEEMAVHADGKFPEKLLYERRPNEPDEVLEYRKKIFSAKTKPTFLKIFASLQKIRRSSDWSIRFEGDFTRIADGESLEDYTTLNYPGFTSLTNWVFTLMLRKYLIDPNAVVMVMPMDRDVDMNEYIQPTAHVFDSVNVLDFADGDFAVLVNPMGAVYQLANGIMMKGKSYYFVTTQSIERYDQINGRGQYSLVDRFEHGLGELPAFQLKGILIDQVEDMYLYESRIGGIIPELNEALREYSDLQASKVLHQYPERWEFSQHECTVCNGTGVRRNPDYVNENSGCSPSIACGSCQNGYVVKGPYSKILVRPTNNATEGASNIPIPPAGYVEKDVEIVKVMEESVERHITNALAAINFEFLAKTPLAESGIAKEVDKDELNNTVHAIAEDIVAAMDNIYRLIAKYRYGLIYSEKDILNMVPVISVPEKFDILSSAHLVDTLKAAKADKWNPVLQSAVEVDLATKLFYTDPAVRDRLVLVLMLDPLPNVSEDDKMSRLSNKGITEEAYVISSNIQEFVRRAIEEDPKFAEKEVKDQRAVMIRYAQEVMKENEVEVIEPDTGLDDDGNPLLPANQTMIGNGQV